MNANRSFGFFRKINRRTIFIFACFILIATLGWLAFSPVSHDGPVAELKPQPPSSPSEVGVTQPSVAVATPAPAATHAAGPHEETPTCSAACQSHAHLVAAPAAPPSKRAWDYHFLESLATAALGNPLRFELTDGVFAAGTIQHLEHAGGAVIYVSGKLSTPEAGRFFFQKQTLPGKQGDFAGLVEFPASKSAWRIEPSGRGGKSELVKRRLDEVICMLPPPSAEALAADAQEMPPLNPSNVTDYVPPYNDGIISLQSMPGAAGVLYIDYRGGYTPTWGGITYDKPNVTNAQIKDVWKRVAEDYMPFTINVTTDIRVYEAAAENSRQRCICTPTKTAASGAGGVSNMNSWNWTGDTPNWSFYTTGKSAAEVISHEVGHALGLKHDGRITPAEGYYGGQGSGTVGWAPIMGVGYSQPVAQWSKGEYASANNTEDDLFKIVTNNNSVDYRPDDTGSTLATARYLEVNSDRTVFAEGVIETTGDTDAFRFTTTGGAVSLSVNPVGDWSDLAIMATLADSTDTVIATNNVQTQLAASIAMTLPAGTYTLRVTGAGRNDPAVDGFSNYASLGYYSISGSVTNGVTTTRFSIAENSGNGTAVGTVTTTNPGADPLVYTIVSGNTNSAFALNNSGALTVANVAALNYETLAVGTQLTVQYELFVNITNATNPALNETNRRVVVQVQDVNEAPGITGGAVTVLEHSTIGTNILMPTATDPDQFDFATFSITAGNTGNAFAINSGTGQITVAADIDVTANTVYNLTVTVADHGTPALTASVVVPITVVNITAGYTPGRIVRTYFESITGSTVATLTSNAKFPNTPGSEQFLTAFDGLTHGDNFGSTIRGYLIPPATGTYQFWIASDDASELRLSSNESPDSASAIAIVAGSTSQYAWTANASQQSVAKTLTAGQPYYIEARHKEGTGADHVAVAWTGPGITRQVIPGLYLAPYYQNYAPKPVAATYTIRENAVPGQPVGVVTSSDVNAQDTFSYVITGGNTGGVFAINSTTGQLSVALPGLLNALTTPSYSLTIQSTDNGTPVLNGSGTVTVNVVAATGINGTNIIQEIWSDITGTAVANLTASVNYPYKPTLRRTLTSFDTGENYGANYGSRIRVKFIPPTTDSYKFYVTSDDASNLLFSANATGSGATQIAYVSGWFAYNNWTGNPSQTSAVQALTAGQAVYLETLHKEGSGGDHVQVAYTNSTVTTPTVIPGSMLVPFDINAAPVFSPTSYSYNVTAATATAGMVVGTVTATEPNGEPLVYAFLSGNSQGAFAINSVTGQITVANPAGLSNGTVTLQAAAQDGGLGGVYPLAAATATVVINVTASNTAPAWLFNPVVKPGAAEAVAYSQTLAGSATDVNGDNLTFAKVSGPAWLAVAANGALTGTPGIGSGGLNSFVVRVTDSFGIFTDATLNISVAGVTIAQSGGSSNVAEGGATDTYTVVLKSAPTANVTINIAPDSQVTRSPTSLEFTTTNWSTPQTVTVTAVNDSLNEFSHTGSITHSATSAEANYNGISIVDVLVNITDNDNTAPSSYAGPDQAIYLTGSSWAPGNLNPGLWLDASDSATITLNGSTVSQWSDKSGNNRHATQATAANQPASTASGLNGKTVLTFDGSSDFFSVNLDFLAGVSHSAFIVTKPTTYNNIYGAASGSAGANSLHVGFGGSTTYRMNYWGNDYVPAITTNFVAGSANIINYIWTSGTSKQVLGNGKSEGSISSAGVIGTMSGGGRICNVVGQGYFGGTIAEIIMVPTVLSAEDRQKLEGYLAHKWGLAANLAANHPYKTQSPSNAIAVATLEGAISDANGDTLTSTWTLVSGPAGASVSFANANAVDTNATFTVAGTYTLRLTTSDPGTSTSDDVVITVNPASAGYKVTYAGNNNSAGTVPVDGSSPYASGNTVTVLGNTGALVRSGYNFNNWNTAADGTGTIYSPGATFTITADTTLYAKWVSDADSTWLPTAAGPFNWGDAANWTDGIVASGADRTASFIPNITANQIANLEAPRTIGNILFTDSTNSSHNLTISGANNLTLDRTTGVPVVNVTQADRTLTISSIVAGSVGLEKTGSGTLTLSGNNTYTGSTLVTGGTLSIDANVRLGAETSGAALNLSGGTTLQATATFGLYNGNPGTNNRAIVLGSGQSALDITSSNTLTVAGVISGVGSLIKDGTGTATLRAENTYSGDMIVNTGTLALSELAGADDTGVIRGVLTINAGATVNASTANALGWGGGKKVNTLNINGGLFNNTGVGDQGWGLTVNLTGGELRSNGGTSSAAAGMKFSAGGAWAVNSLASANTSTISGRIHLREGNPGNQLTFNVANGAAATDLLVSAAITAANTDYGIAKNGTGTMTLQGENNYTGATNVNAGTLLINGNQSTATGAVSVAADANLGGTGTIGGSTTIDAGGKLEFDISTAAGSHNSLELASGKTLTFSGASTLTITSTSGAAPGSYILLTAPGGITGNAPATLNLPSGWAATVSKVGNDLVLTVAAVPPGPLANFLITGIPAQVSIGSAITGITLAAKDAVNQTVTSFTGTVTYGGTASITGTSASFVDGVLSGVNVTPTLTGSNLTFTVNDGNGHTGSATFTVQTPYESWAAADGLVGGNAAPNANPDSDDLENLLEYAFGTNPTAGSDGDLAYIAGGAVTNPGRSICLNVALGEGVDFRAVFARRKDYQAAGLTYTVQFSADLTTWTTSTATPTVLTGSGVGNPAAVEAVSVPYPLLVSVSDGGYKKPNFFRINVSLP